MAVVDALHDAIDKREELAEKASAIVDRVLGEKLEAALDESGGDIPEAMALLADLVEDELANLTTEAVQAGAASARAVVKA